MVRLLGRRTRALLSVSALALGGLAGLLPVRGEAQESLRRVEGRVQRPVAGGDSARMVSAVGAWVTLHRVGKDVAGPIDSVRTDAGGRYRLQYRLTGATDAVYFASTTWGGIAYFTAPFKAPVVAGEDAVITVFDTTSRQYPLSIKGRHLIISALDSTDQRTVVEVYEVANDSVRTLVSPDGTPPSPTWTARIPSAARDVRVNEGEISPEAFVASEGRVAVFAPIAPGLKQVAFSYKLPSSSFPLALSSESNAVVFEVLLEDPRGTVTAKGMTAVQPVTLEQRSFRRFLAQDVPAGTALVIEMPSAGMPTSNLYIAGLLVGLGFLMLLVLTRSTQRAAARAAPAGPVRPVTAALHPDVLPADRLAQEIAALDALFAQQQAPSDDVRRAYEQRRGELRDALAAALAGSGPGR